MTSRQQRLIQQAAQRFARSIAKTLPRGQAEVTLLQANEWARNGQAVEFDLKVLVRVVSEVAETPTCGLFDEPAQTSARDRA